MFNPSETTIISNLSTSHLKSVVNYLNISSVQINYINLDDSSHPNTRKALKCETQKYQREIFMHYFVTHDWNMLCKYIIKGEKDTKKNHDYTILRQVFDMASDSGER